VTFDPRTLIAVVALASTMMGFALWAILGLRREKGVGLWILSLFLIAIAVGSILIQGIQSSPWLLTGRTALLGLAYGLRYYALCLFFSAPRRPLLLYGPAAIEALVIVSFPAHPVTAIAIVDLIRFLQHLLLVLVVLQYGSVRRDPAQIVMIAGLGLLAAIFACRGVPALLDPGLFSSLSSTSMMQSMTWLASFVGTILSSFALVLMYRHKAEQDLRRANDALNVKAGQLARSNAELEQFAYVASHDLRQPLRMVSGHLGILERRFGQSLTQEAREFLGFAVDGARRMDRLIVDLLEYARLGRDNKPHRPVDLAAVLAETAAILEPARAEAGAEIVIAAGLPAVSGDADELVRLFQNLIGNALKYRHPLRTARIDVSCRNETGGWIIRVQDNGTGIRPEDRERAFLIFQRMVGPDACEGTGIGLAICKKIVESHGGRIWIEDGADGGTAVCLWLPRP